MDKLFVLFFTHISLVLAFELVSIDKIKSKFLFSIFSILFIISVYAVIKTNGYSIYVIPLIFSLFLVVNNNFKFLFKINFSFNIVYSVFIWLLFYFFYYNFGSSEFRFVPDDYLIFSRIAHYNDVFGNENMGTFYNIFNTPSNDVYHFTEMWGMAMFRFFNNQSLINNYYLVLCPFFVWISFLGLKELFDERRGWLVFIIILIILFATFPLDIIVSTKVISLPLVGIGSFIWSAKNIFILPVLISVFLVLKNDNLNYIVITSYLYPVIIPVLYAGLFIYYVLYKRDIIKFTPLFFGGILFLLYALFLTNSSGFIDLYNFLDFSVIRKVIGVGLFLPLIFIGPILYFNVVWKNFSIDVLVIIICVWFSSLIFWILLYSNIDANQMFRNVFSSIFVISVGSFLYYCLVQKRNKLFLFLISVFVLPFFLVLYFTIDFTSNKKFYSSQLIGLLRDQNVLVIPNKSNVNSVYDYNEKFYIPHLGLFLYEENVNLITISAAFPNTSRINNFVSSTMVDKYREESIYFNECGFFDFSINPCLIKFMSNHGIDFLLIEEFVDIPNFHLIFSEGNLNLYRFDNYNMEQIHKF